MLTEVCAPHAAQNLQREIFRATASDPGRHSYQLQHQPHSHFPGSLSMSKT